MGHWYRALSTKQRVWLVGTAVAMLTALTVLIAPAHDSGICWSQDTGDDITAGLLERLL